MIKDNENNKDQIPKLLKKTVAIKDAGNLSDSGVVELRCMKPTPRKVKR